MKKTSLKNGDYVIWFLLELNDMINDAIKQFSSLT
jgi:hypothetical protein